MRPHTASLFLFSALVALSAATKVYADCDASLLSGRYAAFNQGTIFDDRLLNAGVGIITFDGNSQWSLNHPFSVSQGRGPGPQPDLSGTYTVDADCSGTLVLDQGTTVKFVIWDDGNEVHGVVVPSKTTPNRVVTWEFKKQSRKNYLSCHE